jgi:acetylornithine deacetylase/succinyl-diaminopimelate desuccinylase-like protein
VAFAERVDLRSPADEQRVLSTVDSMRDEMVALLQDLVRLPSENTPPTGAEAAARSLSWLG